MAILKADKNHINIIKDITHNTIKAVYPRYYPAGAVDFFIQHHKTENIISDIESGFVYILVDNNSAAVGTVTVKDNEINRLFVLPEYQGKGFGSALLDFAEEKVFENHDEIVISASLPAKSIYLRRNYKETSYHRIAADNGDFLCYDEMKKNRKKKDN